MLETNEWLRKTLLRRREWKAKFYWVCVWREGYLISFKRTCQVSVQVFVKMLVILNWKLYRCCHSLIISNYCAFGCLAYLFEVKKENKLSWCEDSFESYLENFGFHQSPELGRFTEDCEADIFSFINAEIHMKYIYQSFSHTFHTKIYAWNVSEMMLQD